MSELHRAMLVGFGFSGSTEETSTEEEPGLRERIWRCGLWETNQTGHSLHSPHTYFILPLKPPYCLCLQFCFQTWASEPQGKGTRGSHNTLNPERSRQRPGEGQRLRGRETQRRGNENTKREEQTQRPGGRGRDPIQRRDQEWGIESPSRVSGTESWRQIRVPQRKRTKEGKGRAPEPERDENPTSRHPAPSSCSPGRLSDKAGRSQSLCA